MSAPSVPAPATRTTTPSPQRPRLELRTPSPTATQLSRTTAEALAAATGATISRTEDGFAAVTFEAPPKPAPAQPTVSRAISIDQLETRPATPERETPARSAPPPQQPSPEAATENAPSTDKDEIYEYVVDRLKRDLFAEQEQAGLGPTLL